MKHLKQYLLLCLVALSVTVSAQRTILHYDFANATPTTVADKSKNNVTAILKGGATTTTIGRQSVLYLGAEGGYLDMTAKAGEVFRGVDNYSISTYYYIPSRIKVEGNGFFLWAFSTHEACGATEGRFSCYRLNAQRIETSVGGYTRETGYEEGKPTATGRWIHVAYTQDGTTGRLYINGTLRGQIENMPLNSVNYAGQSITNCWLGRPPFKGDKFLEQTFVADFRIYDGALSAKQVARLASKTKQMDAEMPASYSTHAPNIGLQRHNFFYAGEAKNRDVYQVRNGRIAWEFHDTEARGEISDAILLSDGHMFLAHQFGLKEIDRQGRTVWSIDAPEGTEIHTVQPIGRHHVVYVQNGKPLKAIVMEIPSCRIVKEIDLPYDERGSVHGQVRCARLTSRGTLLVGMMGERRIIEVDADGRVLNRWNQPDGVWGIELQPDGNMLVTVNSVVSELNPQGERVWQADLAPYISKPILQKSTRLPNGNIVVTNWFSEWGKEPVNVTNPPIQALEIDRQGRLQWVLKSWTQPAALGPSTTFQLLSKPVKRSSLHFGEYK